MSVYELTHANAPTSPAMKTREPKELTWSKVNFQVGEKKILEDIWGTVPAGKVCAILGPSGSGKSSLLNVLAGRSATAPGIVVDGKIKHGGVSIDPVEYRQNIAYVMQDDALNATSTPREALKFSARLRLGDSRTNEELDQLVEDILISLGIDDCADTLIGNAMIKGISGGQRKWTSVGIEIITNPSLLFLDEPTSGLDSFAAYQLVRLLKDVADTNCTVLCTIHQPSSEVFMNFDMCIFLLEGRILYQGPVENMTAHFSKFNFHCPQNYNPADYLMFLCQTESIEGSLKSAISMESSLTKVVSGDDLQTLVSMKESAGVSRDMIMETKAGFFQQLYYLLIREKDNTFRNKGALIGRFGITIFLNCLFSLIFMDAGDKDDSIPSNLNSHFGAITMITISTMMGSAQPIMLAFPFERPMFMREYTTGTYGAIPYFLSKLAWEMPLTLLQCLVQYILAYYLVGFQGFFIYLVLAAWGLSLAAGSTAVFIGCGIKDMKTAMEVFPILFVPQLLFAGFFIKTEQIPVFLRWAQYLCSLKYSINLIVIAEFDESLDSCKGAAAENCRMILEENDINEDDWWIYLLILLLLFVSFRVVAAYVLIANARRFY